MHTRNRSPGTKPVRKLPFRLALPTVPAHPTSMPYSIADCVCTGHMHGKGAQALTGTGYACL